MKQHHILLVVMICACTLTATTSSRAADLSADGKITRSRILATGGATTIEGAAGGGIVPMAVISSYGAQEEQGATAFLSHVDTGDFSLDVVGASWSWHNRIELSFAQQELTHQALTDALGLPDNRIRQRIIGAKVRLAGDLIYTPMPQLSLAIQHKKNLDFFVPGAVGAEKESGTDINLTATKLFLGGLFDRNLLINTNLRYTNANQSGLVGFGGNKNSDKELMAEISAGVFMNRHWLVGSEYRQKPNNLSLQEDDWKTYFVGWFPNKKIALVAAYVDLGEMATFKNQTGWYLSLQGSF
jgi:hypothetical protein